MDRLAPQEAADAIECFGAVQLVGLQELTDVVVVDAHGGHLHRAHVHRLERDAEHGVVGQDHALPGEAHLRLLAGERDGAFDALRDAHAAVVADRLFQRDGDLAGEPLLRVDLDFAAFDARAHRALIRTHQAVQILMRIEIVGEAHRDVLRRPLHRPHLRQLEGFARGNFDLLIAVLGHPDRLAVPGYFDCLRLLLAKDAAHREVVALALGVVLPDDAERVIREFRQHHLLHSIHILHVRGHHRARQ